VNRKIENVVLAVISTAIGFTVGGLGLGFIIPIVQNIILMAFCAVTSLFNLHLFSVVEKYMWCIYFVPHNYTNADLSHCYAIVSIIASVVYFLGLAEKRTEVFQGLKEFFKS
jgi:hypothetical protein